MFLKSDINWEQLFEASAGAAADQPSQWRRYVIEAKKCRRNRRNYASHTHHMLRMLSLAAKVFVIPAAFHRYLQKKAWKQNSTVQQTQCGDYLQQIPAAKDKLTVLLAVLTPALEENSSFHSKTPTFPPVASCLHYHFWGGSSGFSQKRQNCSSQISQTPSPLLAVDSGCLFSHSGERSFERRSCGSGV